MSIALKSPCFRRGFTLIELLVVITIIGILAGLAFPAIQGALNAAKKTQASNMVNQLRTAMTSYQTEYGTWPSSITDENAFDPGTKLYKMLIGQDSPAGTNARQIVFMEFNLKDLRTSSSATAPPADASTATTFLDPWNQVYQMEVDFNYDNQLSVPGGTINAAIAVWSTGLPKNGAVNTDTTKFLSSWK